MHILTSYIIIRKALILNQIILFFGVEAIREKLLKD
jgi:hypothetical protein